MVDKNLKIIMQEKNITVSGLSRLTGIAKSTISYYLNGKATPSHKRVEAIAKALECRPEELLFLDRVPEPAKAAAVKVGTTTLTCKQAATLMHKHESYVRRGLQEGRPGFEFGSAVKTSENRWSYFISAAKFTDVTGIPVTGI